VTFTIACPVFALAIRLVDGLTVDVGTCRPSTLIVRVDIIHLNEQAGVGHICCNRRIEMILRSGSVQPNRCRSDTDFPMDRAAIASSMYVARNEPKRLHQEVMRRRNVSIGEYRDQSFEGWQEHLLIAIMDVKSREEALALARRFMELHLRHWPTFEGECEVRPFEEEAQPAS
jgi:hypothetical protein